MIGPAEQVADDDDSPIEEVGAKQARINAIRARGDEPAVELARRQIGSEHKAYLVEAAVIDVLRRQGAPLANLVRGHGSSAGLIGLAELDKELSTPQLVTTKKAILIRLGRWVDQPDIGLGRAGYGYKPGMSVDALYHSTRGWWRIDRRVAYGYPYAVCVYQGVTRAVWEIDHTSWRCQADDPRRVAFDGRRIEPGEAPYEAFIGEHGRRVPPKREDGRAVFGSQGSVAYWPSRQQIRRRLARP